MARLAFRRTIVPDRLTGHAETRVRPIFEKLWCNCCSFRWQSICRVSKLFSCETSWSEDTRLQKSHWFSCQVVEMNRVAVSKKHIVNTAGRFPRISESVDEHFRWRSCLPLPLPCTTKLWGRLKPITSRTRKVWWRIEKPAGERFIGYRKGMFEEDSRNVRRQDRSCTGEFDAALQNSRWKLQTGEMDRIVRRPLIEIQIERSGGGCERHCDSGLPKLG